MIRVKGLRKQFGSAQILRGIDFEVGPQTVLGIIGASGSGKTTLLRCLNGLERAIGYDLVDARIDLGLQFLVTLAQTDDVKAAHERRARRFQFCVTTCIKSFGGNIHEHCIDALQLEISIRTNRIFVAAEWYSLLLQESRRRGIAECTYGEVSAIGERLDSSVVASDR